MTAHAKTPRQKTVPVRFTDEGVDRVDQMRGTWSRSEYIRRAVALAVKQGKKGPEQKPEAEEW